MFFLTFVIKISHMSSVYKTISELQVKGKAAVLCIVTKVSGSSPGKPGMKMIVYPDGNIEGTIGGGTLEKEVIEFALQMKGSTPECLSYTLKSDLQMECGGNIEVYLEPVKPPCTLLIFGAGHIGKFLSSIAPDFGFTVTVIDERHGIFEGYDTGKTNCINLEHKHAINDLSFHSETFIVIVTHQHAHDEDILMKTCKKQYAYLGMIGSKTKVATIKKRLLENKILGASELDKIDMPIGIKFNAVTHTEIGISILAKLIDVRNSLM